MFSFECIVRTLGFLIQLFNMATNATKQKLNTKIFKVKYNALKEVLDGISKSKVTLKYRIPKNTLSNWFRNKEKI